MSIAKTSMMVGGDSSLKKQAQKICLEHEIDMTTEANVSLHESIRSRGFPFDVNNTETLMAMDETEKGAGMYGPFHSVEELMESLNADD